MPDPVSAALGGLQAVGGIVQSIIGGRRARKATQELENLKSPTTTSSASINDYYNRASANPYDTAAYRLQKEQLERNAAAGISALQGRRAGLLGINSILRSQNDATLRAAANAEQMQRSMFADATRLKANDDARVFNINQMMPFERKYSLLASKAAGGNQLLNAGLSNTFGGLGTFGAGMAMGNDQQGTQNKKFLGIF